MGMSPDRKRARAATKEAVEVVRELISRGVVPRRVTVGEVTIEVASYSPPRSSADGTVVESSVRFRGHEDRIADRMSRLRTKGRPTSTRPSPDDGGDN